MPDKNSSASEGPEAGQENPFEVIAAQIAAEKAQALGSDEGEGAPEPTEETPQETEPTEEGEYGVAEGETSPAPQEEDVATLRQRLDELSRAVSAKDRAYANLHAQYQELMSRIAQTNTRQERQEFLSRLERAREDPEEAARLVDELRERIAQSTVSEEAQRAAYVAAQQQAYQTLARTVLRDLGEEDVRTAYDLATRLAAQESRSPDYFDLITTEVYLLNEKTKQEANARAEKDAQTINELRQKLAALEAEQAATRVRSSPGPERPPGAPRPHLTPEEAAALPDREFERNLDAILAAELENIRRAKAR